MNKLPVIKKATSGSSNRRISFLSRRTTQQRLEILSAIILSLATVASAWCAYQASKWVGVERNLINQASILRSESDRKSSEAMQYLVIDVNMFLKYVQAYSQGDDRLTAFLYDRFQPEMKTAVCAWVALKPLSDPNAPPSPFAMPEYQSSRRDLAGELLEQAEAKLAEGMKASTYSDNYTLLTVIFASVLFFAGIISKFASVRIQAVLLVFSGLTFITGLVLMFMFPIS